MSALHQQRFVSAQIRALGVQHGDRASLERGIDGKNAHELSLPPSWPGLAARQPRLHNNAKTSMPGATGVRKHAVLRTAGPGIVEMAQILGLHRPYFDNVGNEVPE